MARRLFSIALISLILLAVVLLAAPVNTTGLSLSLHPVQDYTQAMQQAAAVQALDTTDLNPVCHTLLLTHQQKAERAIVFFHGYTNCPQQFRALGQKFYELGYNVYIPRMPYHGLSDRLNHEHEKLTAADIIGLANESTDIAQGLGEHVTVAGLSMGGVMAAWLAHQRADVDQAVVISPAFSLHIVPTALTRPFTNLLLWLPNFYRWWRPAEGVNGPPPHGYPQLSSQALGQLLRLGQAVQQMAGSSKPLAPNILVVSNASDDSISRPQMAQIVELWQQNQVENLRTYEFAADLELDHDIIDPAMPEQRIEVVYPILIELINP
jgi:carboxylesterase